MVYLDGDGHQLVLLVFKKQAERSWDVLRSQVDDVCGHLSQAGIITQKDIATLFRQTQKGSFFFIYLF